MDTEKIEDLQHWIDVAPRELEKRVAVILTPTPSTREEILQKIPSLATGEKGECTHPLELAMPMRNEDITTWEESLRGIANLQALAPITMISWSAILNHFASREKPNEDERNWEKENTDLREKLDDALIQLELLKGTNGGGPQKYSVPLFDTCFTDVC